MQLNDKPKIDYFMRVFIHIYCPTIFEDSIFRSKPISHGSEA